MDDHYHLYSPPLCYWFLAWFLKSGTSVVLDHVTGKKNVVQYNSKRTNRDNNIVQTREPGRVVARAFV